MRQPRGREGLLLAGAFLLALAARLLPLPAAHRGGLRLLSPDCYGHLRRSVSIARNFPRVPVRDPWLNHPDGAVWIWPPGFDLLVGGAARLVFGRGATVDQTKAAAAAIPPLLGALHVLPLFAFARRLLGRRRARIAVFAYAALPAAILWSCYGHADQHVAEALSLLLFLAAAARCLDPGLSPRRRASRALLAGLALAGTLFVWQGAVFAAALGLLWALPALGTLAALAGTAAAIATAAVTALTLRGQAVPFSFVSFGWFQPLLVAAGTVPLAAFAALRAPSRRGRAAALVLAVVLLAVVVPLAPRLLGAVARGGAYVTKGETRAGQDDFADGGFLSYPPELMKLIAEAQPLLGPAPGPALLAAVRELSPGLLLLPFALALWGRHALGGGARGRRRTRLLALIFGGALLVMTLYQRRNVYYLAAFTSLALADGAARLARRRTALAAASAGAAVLLLGAPRYGPIASYSGAIGPDVVRLFERLRELDPSPVDPAALPLPPPGAIAGVMPPWSAGHLATAIAGRPAAADPFGYGWRRQTRLYSTPDPEEALRILRGARCRYLVTADLGALLGAYARAAGNGDVPPAAMFLPRVHFSADPHPFPFLTRVLDSRTGRPAPGGGFLPQFRVFRVEGVEDEPLPSTPP